jgi:2'-5' RNA ligase
VRLFVALEIPSAVRENLATFMKEMRELEAPAPKRRARWVRPENLHVTLKFIGEVEPAKLDALCAELANVRSDEPVHLRFRGVGFFPNEKRTRVLWIGIEASSNLSALAAEIDQRLAKVGIPAEKKPFTPHLTLARFEPPGISEKLRTAIQQRSAVDFGELRTSEFHLIQSKLKPGGAEYTTLRSFRFAVEV